MSPGDRGVVLVVLPDGRELAPLPATIIRVREDHADIQFGGVTVAFGLDGYCTTGGFSELTEFLPD